MRKVVSVHFCVIVAIFALGIGVLISPGLFFRNVKQYFSYTVYTANSLYSKWDFASLKLQNGEEFSDFASKNELFMIYFWATWCPHCNNIFSQMQSLKSAKIPVIALTFDVNWDSYRLYREKNAPFWRDLVQHSKDGGQDFVQRKDEFNIPLIPSVWIIKNGKVQKIFIGEKGAKELFPYLEKHNLLSS